MEVEVEEAAAEAAMEVAAADSAATAVDVVVSAAAMTGEYSNLVVEVDLVAAAAVDSVVVVDLVCQHFLYFDKHF